MPKPVVIIKHEDSSYVLRYILWSKHCIERYAYQEFLEGI